MPSSSTLSNAYLSRRKTDEESGMKVPQSFSFMCREGRELAFVAKLSNLIFVITPYLRINLSMPPPPRWQICLGISQRMRRCHVAWDWVEILEMCLQWSRATCQIPPWFSRLFLYTLKPLRPALSHTSTRSTTHIMLCSNRWKHRGLQSFNL